ncbi:MAG: FAD-binding oxidoreductase [Pseudomonadota bacterium]
MSLPLASLANDIGASGVCEDSEVRIGYGSDWSRDFTETPEAVLFPSSLEHVQSIVRWANRSGVSLVPSGGRTGYSGGAVAGSGQVVLSLDKLNQIRDLNTTEQTVICGAGVVTAQLQDFARANGLFYPVDFASSGSSQIGGNIATNAGGIRVIRYGMTRDWVAGLTVVDATGERLDLNRGLIKNNAGYDLRHLMIGSEGTLGIIVEATMRLTSAPPAGELVLLGATSLESILRVLDHYRRHFRLQAFEFFSESGLQLVCSKLGLQPPLAERSPFYALVEVEDDTKSVDTAPTNSGRVDTTAERVVACFEHCLHSGWVTDAVIATSEAQRATLWRYREEISACLADERPYKQDLSTTVSRMPALVEDLDCLFAHQDFELRTVWFGHIGDGNLHLNLLRPSSMNHDDFLARCSVICEQVFAIVRKHGGSISAEHGVGRLKKPYLHYTHRPPELAVMKAIKKALDPKGIMNPGKIQDV